MATDNDNGHLPQTCMCYWSFTLSSNSKASL